MENFTDYLQAGYDRAGTWAKLATKLKVNLRTLTWWRQGKGYPNENTMLRLARYAKQDEKVALLSLCYWGSTARARKVYKSLLQERCGA